MYNNIDTHLSVAMSTRRSLWMRESNVVTEPTDKIWNYRIATTTAAATTATDGATWSSYWFELCWLVANKLFIWRQILIASSGLVSWRRSVWKATILAENVISFRHACTYSTAPRLFTRTPKALWRHSSCHFDFFKNKVRTLHHAPLESSADVAGALVVDWVSLHKLQFCVHTTIFWFPPLQEG